MKHVITHQTPYVSWAENQNKLFLSRKRKVNKTMRKRLNAAVNILKQSKWLQPDQEEVVQYERVEFQPDAVIQFLRRELNNLIRRYNIDQVICVMGAKQFHEATGAMESKYPFHFEHRATYYTNSGYYDAPTPRIAGVLVCVLPWVDGVTLIPRAMWPIEVQPVPTRVALTPDQARTEADRLAGLRAADAWNSFMGRTIIEPDLDPQPGHGV